MHINKLCLSVGDEPLLKDVSFSVEPHTLVGIIGESGAGKSTLMRLLARRLDISTVHGSGTGWLPSNIWFIAQENVLYEYDTPRDCVAFVYDMRHPGAAATERDDAVEAALRRVYFPMQLADQCIGASDGGLSVGARRLLNVAMALAAQPDVILLDEPTTGLDPPTAHQVVRTLRELCDAALCTCAITIHQPNAATFAQFHDVLAMHKGRGFTPDRMTAAPGDTVSPAARLLQLAAEGRLQPSVIAADREPSNDTQGTAQQQARPLLEDEGTAELPRAPLPHLAFYTEVRMLTVRNAKRSWNNIFAFRFRIAMAFALAILLGVTFIQMAYDDARFLRDHMGFYLAANGITFVPIIVAAGFFPAEKPMFVHEFSQSMRVRLPTYMLARTMFEMGFALLLSPTVFIIGAMVGIPDGWGTFWTTLLFQTWVADALGFALSTVIGPAVAIAAAIPAIGFMSMMLGSAVLSPPTGGAGWIFDILKWTSFFKYGFTSLATEHLDYMSGSCTPGVDEGCAFPNAAAMRTFLKLEDTHAFHNTVGFQLMILALLGLALRVVATFTLWGMLAGSRVAYQATQKKKAPTAADTSSSDAQDDAANSTAPTTALAVAPDAESPSPKGAAEATSARVPFELCIDRIESSPRMSVTKPFTMASGELVAIVGPAQSGKSLLLHLLGGQVPIDADASGAAESAVHVPIRTKVAEGEGEMQRRALLEHRFAARIVYPHDDYPMGATTGDLLAYNIRIRHMRNGEAAPSSELIRAESEEVLAKLGLGHIPLDRLCTSMSGGQQRRLSVACQLVHRAPILILDEPTSGLDSEVAVAIMSAVKTHAQQWNVLVLCALQQPDVRVAELCSLVIVMASEAQRAAAGGKRPDSTADELGPCTTCFVGNLDQSRASADAHAYIDFCDDDAAASADGGAVDHDLTWSKDGWLSVMAPEAMDADVAHIAGVADGTAGIGRSISAALTSFTIVFRRMLAARVATPVLYAAELFLKFVFMPLLMAAIVPQVDDPTYSNRLGVLFGIVGSLSFTALVAPTVVASLEQAVRQRELRAGDYGPVTYAVSRWVVELPFDALGTTVGTALAYFIVGFELNYGVMWAAMFCAYQAAVPLGTAIGAIPQPLPVTAGLAAFVTVTFMLTAGVIVTPFQIQRTYILTVMEIFVPARHAVTLLFDAEMHGELPQTLSRQRLG